MQKVLIVIITLFTFSCESKKSVHTNSSRDSLLQKYLNTIDSLPWIDSSEYQHRLLEAFLQNDTVYLKRIITEISDEIKLSKQRDNDLTCPHPAAIDTYNFDEVYRFEYEAFFCDEKSNLTIGVSNDSATLFGYLYKVAFGTDSCISFKKIEKKLTKQEWYPVAKGLYQSDIWGLKLNNGNFGFDGSMLTVTAYRKSYRKPNITKVARWSPEKTTLGQTFLEVLKISSLKPACYNY
jgi:hypothetical protein